MEEKPSRTRICDELVIPPSRQPAPEQPIDATSTVDDDVDFVDELDSLDLISFFFVRSFVPSFVLLLFHG